MIRDLSSVGRDFNSLMANLPRQLRQLMRRFTSPDFALKIDMQHTEVYKEATHSAAKTVFSGMLIASLILSATLFYIWGDQPIYYGIPVMTAANYSAAFVLFIYTFVKK